MVVPAIDALAAGALATFPNTATTDSARSTGQIEVRLDRAHHDLDSLGAGAPTVAEVARRWGFAHSGRFRAAMHRRCGQDPADLVGPRGRRLP